ncbi:MAG: MBL fold metallo-hydrolase [Candidatus Margulisbacteria bacterium]|nr:MBL fold metallo-hydrolase [Candidatus Margulisiibacteriota bacterium]
MDFIKFLGTAGARVVVSRQLRASGGIWLSLDGTNLSIDPGPGALVKALASRPKLDPTTLDGILISHKHLDHSGDVNAMIEAMTAGTFKKRGVVFAPAEAYRNDPVILKYVRKYPERLEILKEKQKYKVGSLSFTTPIKHIHHNTETYGFKFRGEKVTLSYISDTKYFPGLIRAYKADVLVVGVLRPEPSHLEHLCVEDLKKLVRGIKPKITIMTHFGMWMVRAKPWLVAEQLSRELNAKVIAAEDGMKFEL